MLQDDRTIEPLTYGRIASYYYLKHQTVRMFKERLRAELPIHELLSVLTVSFTLWTYSCCGHLISATMLFFIYICPFTLKPT